MGKKKYNKSSDRKGKAKDDLEMKDKTSETADSLQESSKSKHESGKRSRKEPKGSKRPSMNDARWYMPSDKIMQNYNYALEGFLGKPLSLSDEVLVSEKLPSVMAIDFAPTPGDTDRDILNFSVPNSAAINVAARVLLTSLASENKKPTNYQPQDLALAIFAEAQLIMLFSTAARLYSVGLQFNMMNRDIPRMLIAAMGVDPDTFPSDSDDGLTLSDFRDIYNVLAQQANSLPFVGGIKEFEKAWAMFSSYYCDTPGATSQLYVPALQKVGIYKEDIDPEDPETMIKTIEYETLFDRTSTGLMPVKKLLNTIKKMLDNLNTSSLMNYVYPDILNFMRAKGAKNYVFPLLDNMYVAPPVYNELWLTQVHNLFIPGVPTMNPITQDPTRNVIETHITWSCTHKTPNFAQIIDFPFTDTPSVEDKIDATMFKVALKHSVGDTAPFVPSYQTANDFIPLGISVYGCDELLLHFTQSTVVAVPQLAEYAQMLSKFKYAPILYICDQTSHEFVGSIGDLNAFSVVRYADLKPLFDQAVLGLYTYDAEHTLTDFNS